MTLQHATNLVQSLFYGAQVQLCADKEFYISSKGERPELIPKEFIAERLAQWPDILLCLEAWAS